MVTKQEVSDSKEVVGSQLEFDCSDHVLEVVEAVPSWRLA
jgi:hypothetical protein